MKNFLGVLGLANKAGAIEAGTNNVLYAIKSGKAKLILLAADASDNTKKLLTDKATYRNIKMLTLPISMDELAKILGKQNTSSATITDDNFIAAFKKQLIESSPDISETNINRDYPSINYPDKKTIHGGN